MMEQERQAASEERVSTEAAEPTRGRRGWLSALVAGVALVAVVAVFAAVALARSGAGTSSQSPLGASAAPVSWKVYHDPLGLYSIRIPANWTASVTTGAFSEGDREGGFSGTLETVQLSDPRLGQASARIWISASQINSVFGRQYLCGARSLETSSFNGYPAQGTVPPGTVVMFESYNAHFQIDVEIPGVLVPANPGGPMIPNPPPPTPTPLPSSWVKADRAILATALTSLKPAAKPLSCG